MVACVARMGGISGSDEWLSVSQKDCLPCN
jgi:hypothetical protein